MNTMQLLQQIFEVCIIPLLGVLTAYLIALLRRKTTEIQEKTESDLADKYLEMAFDTVARCVQATNQTYVDSLKGKEIFTKEAQAEAFQKTYDNVMIILTEDAKNYLNSAVGDLQLFITTLIEAEVKMNKKGNE